MDESNTSIYEDVEYLITSFSEDIDLNNDEKSNTSSTKSNLTEITQIPAKTKVSLMKQSMGTTSAKIQRLPRPVTRTTKEDSDLMSKFFLLLY
jgi:hypothetical protein